MHSFSLRDITAHILRHTFGESWGSSTLKKGSMVMKRICREDQKFELMRMLNVYSRARGVSIRDEANHTAFLSELLRKFETSKKNPILIHGLRTEAMFAHIAATMGHCVAIKTEDAGDVYLMDSGLRIPDFRILTSAGQELFVEVKNHHPANPTDDFKMNKDYFESLKRYAVVFNRGLYFAIYWSQWKLWSLVRQDRFDTSTHAYRLSIENAMMRNEMNIIGDCLLATVSPLELRLFSDPNSTRIVKADGTVKFKIAAARLFAGGKEVDNSLEKRIAWFFMNYGNWIGTPGYTEVCEGEIISVGLTVAPEERANPNERFETVGQMSQMLSRQFNEITVGSEGVDLLIPKSEPEDLGVMIPSDYKGEKLPLWRFYQQLSIREEESP